MFGCYLQVPIRPFWGLSPSQSFFPRVTSSLGWTRLIMTVFKLDQCTEKHWRWLNGRELIQEVIREIRCVDGVRKIAD